MDFEFNADLFQVNLILRKTFQKVLDRCCARTGEHLLGISAAKTKKDKKKKK